MVSAPAAARCLRIFSSSNAQAALVTSVGSGRRGRAISSSRPPPPAGADAAHQGQLGFLRGAHGHQNLRRRWPFVSLLCPFCVSYVSLGMHQPAVAAAGSDARRGRGSGRFRVQGLGFRRVQREAPSSAARLKSGCGSGSGLRQWQRCGSNGAVPCCASPQRTCGRRAWQHASTMPSAASASLPRCLTLNARPTVLALAV